MIKEAIIKLAKKQDLTYTEAEAVMNEIMSGEATPVQKQQLQQYLEQTFAIPVQRQVWTP